MLALGEQEAVQIVRAGEQLGTDLAIGGSAGTFAHSAMADFGDFAEQMALVAPFPPATADLPVYDALRSDLAASGDDALQPENLKTSPMRSWIGLYALLYMIRDAEITEFTPEAIKTLAEEAQDVPMLDMYGGENWTPDTDHPGMFMRAGHEPLGAPTSGIPRPRATSTATSTKVADMSFDEVLCGSIFGAPPEEC